MEWRRRGKRELVPVFAAQIGDGKTRGFELRDGVRADATGSAASRAVGVEVRTAFLVEDDFRHDGTGGVSGAEEEDVVGSGHEEILSQADAGELIGRS
jgi:hypothetical protein